MRIRRESFNPHVRRRQIGFYGCEVTAVCEIVIIAGKFFRSGNVWFAFPSIGIFDLYFEELLVINSRLLKLVQENGPKGQSEIDAICESFVVSRLHGRYNGGGGRVSELAMETE